MNYQNDSTMALISKHYLIAQAISAALNADTELTDAITGDNKWLVRKKAWHRNMTWEAGTYVVPLRGLHINHENLNLRIKFDTVVAAVWPSDQHLTRNMEQELAVQERIDHIFAGQGRTTMPGSLKALDSLGTGTSNQFNVEMTSVSPGENFMVAAFDRGFDAFATIVTVDIVTPKRDAHTLGA